MSIIGMRRFVIVGAKDFQIQNEMTLVKMYSHQIMTVLFKYIAEFSCEDIFSYLKKWGAMAPDIPVIMIDSYSISSVGR